MERFSVDAYVIETLMADLVLHDRHPSAFLVYLRLSYAAAGRKAAVRASLQNIAAGTGLSKSAVQAALRTLIRRHLVRSTRASPTAIPQYTVLRPWRR
jgi:DNA-binding MarR family transcriptional regulator